jgi:serine/threonine protein kinase
LKSSFTEAELWYILKSIAESGAFLQKKGLIIGDIRPQTIFLSHQHNIRIPVLGILPNCMNSNFFKSFIGFK